ncbi:hypothetical protein F4804DRAFT_146494 [Jackrogersella minutella]|nr:hypothetical protein F4804DRAFT_146494 [Jackrogersella minutella]
MDCVPYTLDKCHFEECEATILIRGPYCERHTQNKHLPKFATKFTFSSASNNTMATPEEKLEDAITVKTPLASLGNPCERSEKKQLSDKKVARKTTSSSKPKPPSVITRHPDSRSSLDRSSVGDVAPLDQRPPKKPRLSTDVDKEDRGFRHHVSSFAENISYPIPKPEINLSASEDRDLGSVASDFALRPKGNSTSLEMPPRAKPRDDPGISITKFTPYNSLRKQPNVHNNVRNHGFPTHGLIDLEGDDDPRLSLPSTSNSRKVSHTNTHKSQDNHNAGSHTHSAKAPSGLRHEGKSIEVQIPPNQGITKTSGHNDVSNQNGQRFIRKPSLNSASRHVPKKTPSMNIAPRPVKTLLDPSSPLVTINKQKFPHYPNHPQPTIDKPTDAQRRGGTPIQPPAPIPNIHAARHFNRAAADHIPASATSAAPGPPTTIKSTNTNGHPAKPRSTSDAQKNDDVRDTVKNPKPAQTAKTNGTIHDNSANRSDVSLSRLEPKEATHHMNVAQGGDESGVLKTKTILESQASKSQNDSVQYDQAVQNTVQPPITISRGNIENQNEVENSASQPADQPTMVSMLLDQSLKYSNLEERRQTLISKHDPVKFDSYIYGKNNEPFRPGSALFGLPPWSQPPRPTLQATHFAHIDPRVHWTHPRSESWRREKQKEIRERGTKKMNFGRAVARVAKQKQDEGDYIVDFPDRVTNNPQWLAALDELDEMAHVYHTQRREKHKGRKERKESERYPKTQQRGKDGMPLVVDQDGDVEMDENPFDQSISKSLKDGGWCFMRPK